jgi:hypothetical protein
VKGRARDGPVTAALAPCACRGHDPDAVAAAVAMPNRIGGSMSRIPIGALVIVLLTTACVGGGGERAPASPHDAFLAQFAASCGQAYAGRIVANEPADPADPFIGKSLVMHVRDCGADELRIPFHVGEDRSRTWIIRRTDSGLSLEHDHRHADGSSDVLTMYGGDTSAPGTARRQSFPADAYSRELFERTGRTVSLTNVWSLEIEPGERFVYELARPGRLFRVEFDLSQAVPVPPPAWGYEAPGGG